MPEAESEPGSQRPRKWVLDTTTVMPEYRGLRIVQRSKSVNLEIGELIPWPRVEIHRHQGGLTVFVTPDGCKRSTVGVRGGRRGDRLAARLKSRWSQLVDDDPLVCYEPKQESVRAFLWIFGLIGLFLLACAAYLTVTQAQKFGPLPWSPFRWLAFGFANIHAWLAILILWFLWRLRPRSPQYDRVAISPAGLRMEGSETETVDIAWTEVAASKRVRGDPLRFRLDLVDGQRVWLVVPNRVRHDVLRRMPVKSGGVRPDAAASHRATRALAIRFFIIGIVLSASIVGCVLWLLSRGLLTAADARRIALFGSLLTVAQTWYIASMLTWSCWRSTPKGRRTLRRWSRKLSRHRRPNPAPTP